MSAVRVCRVTDAECSRVCESKPCALGPKSEAAHHASAVFTHECCASPEGVQPYPPRSIVVPIAQAAGSIENARFDLLAHLIRQRAFSERTFGPGARTKGVVDHIRKELLEIEANPGDLTEWIDVVLLALDGAWRAGGSPEEIIRTLSAKQTKNEGRNWPDWRTAATDKAIEHDRSTDAAAVPHHSV